MNRDRDARAERFVRTDLTYHGDHRRVKEQGIAEVCRGVQQRYSKRLRD